MRAARVMKIADIGLVPVCSSGDRRRLLGVITDRDLCLAIVAENMDAATTTIDKCMTRNPVSCRMDEDLDTALQRMEAHQIRRIPVVDNDGNLVGIISQADIATRVGSDGRTAELVEEVSRRAV